MTIQSPDSVSFHSVSSVVTVQYLLSQGKLEDALVLLQEQDKNLFSKITSEMEKIIEAHKYLDESGLPVYDFDAYKAHMIKHIEKALYSHSTMASEASAPPNSFHFNFNSPPNPPSEVPNNPTSPPQSPQKKDCCGCRCNTTLCKIFLIALGIGLIGGLGIGIYYYKKKRNQQNKDS